MATTMITFSVCLIACVLIASTLGTNGKDIEQLKGDFEQLKKDLDEARKNQDQ